MKESSAEYCDAISQKLGSIICCSVCDFSETPELIGHQLSDCFRV